MNRPLMAMLAAALGLTVWMASQDDAATVEPVSKQGSRPAARSAEHAADRTEQPAKPAAQARGADGPQPWERQALIDGVTRWQARAHGAWPPMASPQAWDSVLPPPPPVVKASVEAPPPPVAPPFPHQWLGRFNDETPPVPRAVVSGPQSTWVVRAGDVIEGQWRVDRIQDRTMTLTYLPLQQVQTIAMK
jgi:hypothetical protein